MFYLNTDYVAQDNYPNGLPLYLEADGYETGGGVVDPDDQWSSREDEHVTLADLRLYANDGPGRDKINVGFNPFRTDVAYAVVVRYSTGDTFGHSSGNISIADVYPTRQEAVDHVRHIESIANAAQTNAVVDFSYEFNGRKYQAVWAGYFESLEYVEVLELVVHNEGVIEPAPVISEDAL
jgi:hypothetical protein